MYCIVFVFGYFFAEHCFRLQRCKRVPLDAAVLVAADVGKARSSDGDRSSVLRAAGRFQQLSRLTVAVETPSDCSDLAGSIAIGRTYDLLAVQPGSERAFATACTTLECDIISITLSRRLPFRLRPQLVSLALHRGVAFEVRNFVSSIGCAILTQGPAYFSADLLCSSADRHHWAETAFLQCNSTCAVGCWHCACEQQRKHRCRASSSARCGELGDFVRALCRSWQSIRLYSAGGSAGAGQAQTPTERVCHHNKHSN